VQENAMGKEVEANTESEVGLAVARSGAVAPTPTLCRQSSAGVPSPNSELGGRRGISLVCHHFGIISRQGGKS
jgi:hypothetical protein